MDTFMIKVVGGIFLFLSMVIFGVLPILNPKIKTNPCFLSLCNCFCGGLFFAIGFIHILPQAYNMLDGMDMISKTNLHNCADLGIKWSFLICLISFSMILLLDKVIFNNSDLAEANSHSHNQSYDLRKSILSSSQKSDERTNLENKFKERVSSKYKTALRLSRNSDLKDNTDTHQHDHLIQKSNPKITKSANDSTKDVIQNPEKGTLVENLLDTSQNSSQKESEEDTLKQDPEYLQVNVLKETSNEDVSKVTIEKHEGHVHQNLIKKEDSFLTCIILLVAMGIHGFFSMLAFGLEPTRQGTINLFIALIVHKWSEAITVSKKG